MFMVNVQPIVKWAERIARCTVRGARISKNPQIASILRRHRKLRLVTPEMCRTESRRSQPTKQRRWKTSQHSRKNLESGRSDDRIRFPTSGDDYRAIG